MKRVGINPIGTCKKLIGVSSLLLLLVALAACGKVTLTPDGQAELRGELIEAVTPTSTSALSAAMADDSAEVSPAYVGNWVRIPSFNSSDAIARITRVTTVPSGRRINGQVRISHYARNCVAVLGRPGNSGAYYLLFERCGRFNNVGFGWYATGRNITSVELRICERRSGNNFACGRAGRVYTNR